MAAETASSKHQGKASIGAKPASAHGWHRGKAGISTTLVNSKQRTANSKHRGKAGIGVKPASAQGWHRGKAGISTMLVNSKQQMASIGPGL